MIDSSLPYRAGTAGAFSLADLAQQTQQLRHGEQAMQQRERALNQQDQQFQDQQHTQQLAQEREKMGMIARLTSGVTDEASYQQALGAARSAGIDVSKAPPNYMPEWVQQQHLIATKLLGGPQQNPTALEQNIGLLRRLNPNMSDQELAGVAQYAIAAPRMYGSPEMGWSPDPNYPFGGGPAGNGGITEVTDAASYAAVPPGAQYRDPDGNVRTKPGGAGGDASGNFLGQ
jgi:hypothetical protein